jgi:hypothetical protein
VYSGSIPLPASSGFIIIIQRVGSRERPAAILVLQITPRECGRFPSGSGRYRALHATRLQPEIERFVRQAFGSERCGRWGNFPFNQILLDRSLMDVVFWTYLACRGGVYMDRFLPPAALLDPRTIEEAISDLTQKVEQLPPVHPRVNQLAKMIRGLRKYEMERCGSGDWSPVSARR